MWRGRSASSCEAEPELEEWIRYAAKLAGQSLTDFVLDAASERGEEVIAWAL